MDGSQEGPSELQSCKEGGVLLPFTASAGNENEGGGGRITRLAVLSWTASGYSSLDDFIKLFPYIISTFE